MQNNIVKKGLVIAIIFLFIAVSFQPIVAKDTISPVKKSDTKELLETVKDIANNQKIQKIIQKSEIKGSPIRVQQLLCRLQKEIVGAIEKNDTLYERLKQLSDLSCDCEKDNNPLFFPPILCCFLFMLLFVAYRMAKNENPLGLVLGNIVVSIADVLNCPF